MSPQGACVIMPLSSSSSSSRAGEGDCTAQGQCSVNHISGFPLRPRKSEAPLQAQEVQDGKGNNGKMADRDPLVGWSDLLSQRR